MSTNQALGGVTAGLKSILVDHSYNRNFSSDKIVRVSNDKPWEEIYKACFIIKIDK